jgi:ABC-type uncharacterized transport system substrate-binding protein
MSAMLVLLSESSLRSVALGITVWLALQSLRVRNPHVEMMAWTVVLLASLAMPLLMQLPAPRLTVAIPRAAPLLPLAMPDQAAPTAATRPSNATLEPEGIPNSPPVATEAGNDRLRTAPMPAPIDWISAAAGIYLVVAGMLLLRLLTGLALTWRLWRSARPLREDWTAGADVRVSDAVGMPVTIGSTILLPGDCSNWSAVKRNAVLVHEKSHVACGDFLVLLLANLNRTVFWFNPLSWWLLRRLAELAETISDDAAIEDLGDRPAYAAILLEVASHVRPTSLGIAMARARTVHRRIKRILAATAPSSRVSRRKRILLWLGFLPIVAASATSIARGTPPTEVEHAAGLRLAQANQPARAEIGFLNDLSPDQWQPAMAGFRRGLSEAGYAEGQNVTFVYRWTEGRRDSLPDLAGGLARANVSLIVSSGDTAAALAARAGTSKIPVLFAIDDDPVKFGLAESLDKPGGNATGMYFVYSPGALGTTGQELLRQLVPTIGSNSYVLRILDASSDTWRTEPAAALKNLLDGVRTRNVTLSAEMKQLLRTDPEKALKQLQQQVGTLDDSDRVTPDRMGSLAINSGPFLDGRRRSQAIALAARYAIPTLYNWRDFVEAGGLISQGFDLEDAYVQLGRYAGRILKGAKPADMPVMKPAKVETAINLRTAAELGLSVPPALLARFDKVIQ